jgi:hypothetical protein
MTTTDMPIDMKHSRALLAVLLFACASTSFAAKNKNYAVDESVTLASNVQAPAFPEQCDWTRSLTERLTAAGKTTDADLRVRMQVAALSAPLEASKRSLSTRIRADVFDKDKLVATKDFEESDKISATTTTCAGLKKLAGDLAGEISEWVSETRFPACKEGCAGIRPDDPIHTASLIAEKDEDALSETVRNECKWAEYMPTLVADTYNTSKDPAPRAKLIVEPGTKKEASRRTLFLMVTHSHVIGGGGFSGPKWVGMKGQLYDGELLVADFTVLRKAYKAVMDTCGQMHSISESLAEKISSWLLDPQFDAEL